MEVIRMCICCRRNLPKRELVRVVKSKDGAISVDLTGKQAGRGAYVCKSEQCMAKLRKGALNRAFKCNIDSQIIEQVIGEIVGKDEN